LRVSLGGLGSKFREGAKVHGPSNTPIKYWMILFLGYLGCVLHIIDIGLCPSTSIYVGWLDKATISCMGMSLICIFLARVREKEREVFLISAFCHAILWLG
jgi:hypothetical protein